MKSHVCESSPCLVSCEVFNFRSSSSFQSGLGAHYAYSGDLHLSNKLPRLPNMSNTRPPSCYDLGCFFLNPET